MLRIKKDIDNKFYLPISRIQKLIGTGRVLGTSILPYVYQSKKEKRNR